MPSAFLARQARVNLVIMVAKFALRGHIIGHMASPKPSLPQLANRHHILDRPFFVLHSDRSMSTAKLQLITRVTLFFSAIPVSAIPLVVQLKSRM
ncbi:hypothetical protein PGT21_033722 [Puccinia graminis f. sp. tritici]|uniref:Uncharacterized protein n=1 Tax=Puccinia graminis f. sp. tritici TaxID=56615 RepID=A0A5B0PM32_PUCGR|nr:hypothetical protein PGT21_033722 [Puccinia graminis f. sp. tritici]